MNITEICQLLDHAKRAGVQHLRIGDLSVEFAKEEVSKKSILQSGTVPYPAFSAPATTPPLNGDGVSFTQTAEELLKTLSPFDNLTEDQVLYAATPYADELAAKQQAILEKRKEEKIG